MSTCKIPDIFRQFSVIFVLLMYERPLVVTISLLKWCFCLSLSAILINEKLSYTKNNSNNPQKKGKKRRQKRNIIWFNPLYSANVKTNIGKVFFRTLKKNFPRNNLFYNILHDQHSSNHIFPQQTGIKIKNKELWL